MRMAPSRMNDVMIGNGDGVWARAVIATKFHTACHATAANAMPRATM